MKGADAGTRPSAQLLSWIWDSASGFGFPANSSAWEALKKKEKEEKAQEKKLNASRGDANATNETSATKLSETKASRRKQVLDATEFEGALLREVQDLARMRIHEVGSAFEAYWNLLCDLLTLRESFLARYSHISFDWSALEAVQELHPSMRMLASSVDDVRQITENSKRLKELRQKIEKHSSLTSKATVLREAHGAKTNSPEARKAKGLKKKFGPLDKAVKVGLLRLGGLHRSLFEELHRSERVGKLGIEPPAPMQVERRDAAGLSLREFMEQYAKKRKPVLITGLKVDEEEPWTLEFFRGRCNKTVGLKQLDPNGTSWGRLTDGGEMSLAEFIDTFRENETRKSWYLHDWSLPRDCPEAFGPPPFRGFTMPKYFVGDLFQRAPSVGYQHTWPSLFIGASRTESAMHVDSGGTNFWLHLLSGRKRWVFYPHSDIINLYSAPGQPTFAVDALRPDHERWPLVRYAQKYEAIQEPGELMFIPAGSPHAVTNLEDIHAISMNYVDLSNIHLHLWSCLQSGRWSNFEMFTSQMTVGMRSDQTPLRFGEWKSQQWHEFQYDLF